MQLYIDFNDIIRLLLLSPCRCWVLFIVEHRDSSMDVEIHQFLYCQHSDIFIQKSMTALLALFLTSFPSLKESDYRLYSKTFTAFSVPSVHTYLLERLHPTQSFPLGNKNNRTRFSLRISNNVENITGGFSSFQCFITCIFCFYLTISSNLL